MKSIAEIQELDGKIIPVIKPAGITSFGVVAKIRKATGIKKIGHAGTLDPFAEGVLVVGVGRKATRQLNNYVVQEKEYVARVELGIETDTYDSTGKVLVRNDFIMPERERLEEVFRMFRGEIEQLPPAFSAVKVNGVRAYKAARQGKKIELKPRKVRIYSLELLKILSEGFDLKIVCSKGTYIRTLACDIGRALGMGANLKNLVRTRVGQFEMGASYPLEVLLDFAQNYKEGIDEGHTRF